MAAGLLAAGLLATGLLTTGLLAAGLLAAGLLTAGLLTTGLLTTGLLAAGLLATGLLTAGLLTAGLLAAGLLAAGLLAAVLRFPGLLAVAGLLVPLTFAGVPLSAALPVGLRLGVAVVLGQLHGPLVAVGGPCGGGASGGVGGLRIGLGHLAFQLVGELIEPGACLAEGLQIITEHRFRGAGDAGLEIVEIRLGAATRAFGFRGETLTEHFGGGFERFGGVLSDGILQAVEQGIGHQPAFDQFVLQLGDAGGFVLVETAHGFLETPADDRFRGLRGFSDLGGAIDEVGEPFLLRLDPFGEIGFGLGRGERGLAGGWLFLAGQIFVQFLLTPGEFAGFGAHLAEVLGELAGVLLPHLVTNVFELSFRAGAGGEGLGHGTLAGGVGGPLHIVAGLLELLALFGHARLVFGRVHPLLKFVHVGEHLLLLFLETLEPASDFLLFLFRVGFAQGGLEFLQPFVDVLLAAGQFLEPVEHLELFAAGGVGGGLGLVLGLVTVFGVGEFELIHLPIPHLLAGTAPALLSVAGPGDLDLALPEAKQRLVGGLFRFDRGGQGIGGLDRGVELLAGLLHGVDDRFPERRGAWIVVFVARGLGLLKSLRLGIPDHGGVGGQLGGGGSAAFAFEFPGGIDDLLLEFRQAAGGTALAFAFLLLLGGIVGGFAEDLLEGADLGEVHVGGGAPDLAVGTDVIGPEVPGKQLIRTSAELLQSEQVSEALLLLAGNVAAEFEELRFPAAVGVGEAVGDGAEVVPDGAFEGDFLEGGRPDIAAGRGELQFRSAVGEHLEHELGGFLVGSAVGIDQLEVVGGRE